MVTSSNVTLEATQVALALDKNHVLIQSGLLNVKQFPLVGPVCL